MRHDTYPGGYAERQTSAVKLAWQPAGDDAQKEQWYSLAATVRAFKASQAMGRAPADRRRGGTPVELRQQPLYLPILFLNFYEPGKGATFIGKEKPRCKNGA